MKNWIRYSALSLTFLLFFACKKEVKPEDSFIKIYDDQVGSTHYVPLSISKTSDQGYLILSACNGWKIQIMKIDQAGEYVWHKQLASNYVNAVPNIVVWNAKHYFVCMDEVGLFTYVMEIDESTRDANVVSSFPNMHYPTYAYANESAFYIQNYNRWSYETEIHRLDGDLSAIDQSGAVSVLTNVEQKLIDHVTYTGKRMPFFITTTPEKDYVVMSGFNNYSFSTVFLNNDLQMTGVYNGTGYNGGFNTILPLGSLQFAVGKFAYSNVFFTAKTTLNPATIDISESISAEGYPELDSEKPFLTRTVQINNTKHIAYLATTNSNQLLLQLYSASTGKLVGKKYIGQNTPYRACDLIQTNDSGLLLLIQAKVMGSFNRIATVKLSKEELEKVVE